MPKTQEFYVPVEVADLYEDYLRKMGHKYKRSKTITTSFPSSLRPHTWKLRHAKMNALAVQVFKNLGI